jgi:hypothetical protein
MKDLKSQLEGVSVPPADPASPEQVVPEHVPVARRHPLLGEQAHQGAEWWRRAKAIQVPGAQKRPIDAKLHAAIQQTDALLKAMKKAGRGREAEEIADLRKRWLGEREQLAWGLVKEALQAIGVSDKLYRSFKQGDVDPVDLLLRLDKVDTAELQGMGVQRLRAFLLD